MDRFNLGAREPNKIYKFMEKVSNTNIKYMGPEATNTIWRLNVAQLPPIEPELDEEGSRYFGEVAPGFFYKQRWPNHF